jgi:hypothetical protein
MRQLALAIGLVLPIGGGWAAPSVAAPAPVVDPRTACATGFAATTIAGDPNAVVVRIIDPVAPPTGTITAYGRDMQWSGTIERSALTENRYGTREASITVRADAPIEGIVYAPAWAPCTFRAGARPRDGYDLDDVQRPVLSLSNAQPAPPVTCTRPFAAPTVLHAVEPTTPLAAMQMHAEGTVRVAVALDERGVPQFARIVFTPAGSLNAASIASAMGSTYSPAIFRCEPVPSGYEFSVNFSM